MKKKSGFTLAETVLALAVVGLLLTGFIAIFMPARKSIQGALAIQEADRLTLALKAELDTLRAGDEQQKYTSAFDKAFDWMRKTDQANRSILIYNYRGDLKKTTRSDGSLQPYTKGPNFIPGDDTMVTTAVILAEQDRQRIEEDSEAIVGPVFVIRMTQLVWKENTTTGTLSGRSMARRGQSFGESGGKYVLSTRPGTIANPYSETQLINDPKRYVYNPSNKSEMPWGAEVLYYAEFFQLPALQKNAVRNLKYENLRQPLFSRCLSFRR